MVRSNPVQTCPPECHDLHVHCIKHRSLLCGRVSKQLQELLPQKVRPLPSGGLKPQAYLSQNTLVEMTLG